MSIDTTFDELRRVRTHIVTGTLTFGQLRDTLIDLYSDEMHAGYHVLWDLRGANLNELTVDHIRGIVDLVKRHWGGAFPARGALVTETDSAYGLARMYEQLLGDSADRQVRVFRDIEAATEWVTGGMSGDDER